MHGRGTRSPAEKEVRDNSRTGGPAPPPRAVRGAVFHFSRSAGSRPGRRASCVLRTASLFSTPFLTERTGWRCYGESGCGGLARNSRWPLSGNCTEKQLPTDTPRPTASFGPCHRPRVPRRACVEPRPLVQTGPQGDSLPACGTRRRRRPSRLERARRREAHWTVVASPLAALSPSASGVPRSQLQILNRFDRKTYN